MISCPLSNSVINWGYQGKVLGKYCVFPFPIPNCQTPLQLANPTQLQLVGVGVDSVFPRKKKEGSRRNNLHLASGRRNDPTCLNQ